MMRLQSNVYDIVVVHCLADDNFLAAEVLRMELR
jgi:hypothetical protein